MPAGQQIALQPALHLVLESISHAAHPGEVVVDLGPEEFGVPLFVGDVETACRRFDAVSSGPKIRKFSGLSRTTSVSHWPSTG